MRSTRMKKYFMVILFIPFVFACSNKNLDAKQIESQAIYGLVINRAEKNDKCKVLTYDSLIVKPIDSNNLIIIKSGIRHFTNEIEKAITDYNLNDGSKSKIALFNVSKVSNKDMKYQLSTIGFNDSLNNAVVYEKDNINPDLGHGTFIFLIKNGTKWEIDSEILEME